MPAGRDAVPGARDAARDAGPGGVRDAATLRLLAEEYTKWLASTLGLSALGPPHDGARPAATAHASARS